MGNIDELQHRVMAAMDRVASGLSQLSVASEGDTEALQQALDDEKVVTAQLTERIRVLTERHSEDLAKQQAHSDNVDARLGQLDADLQRLRKANAQLAASNQALRDANSAGVGEPHLINKAMMAELEALRATRAVDVAEANTIIDALTPLLDATGKEDV